MAGRPSDGNNRLVIPTASGRDLDNHDETRDGHIRLETYRHNGTNIYVDLFDSSMDDSSQAYLTSETFPHTKEGADEATKFLQDYGFQVSVALK